MKPDTISNDCQLDSSGQLIHLLGLKDLPKKHLENILDRADGLLGDNGGLKKSKALKGMSVANLFFEPSTRTRNTFEIAAKRSSANTINVDLENSATKKNETLMDTMQTLKAMQIDMFIIRHKKNGLPHHVAENIEGVAIINAGDGINAHPTQALLALKTLGTKDIRLIAPAYLLYKKTTSPDLERFDNLEKGLEGVDIIMSLRLQKERMVAAEIPNEKNYFENYGITNKTLKLAKPDAIVMHPGPVNRGIEVDSSVADGPQSVILKQVTNGIAVRMAAMEVLAGAL